ncbi:hypothetical protein FC093_08060 [Ilyomonas limi]|uniref:Glycoside hydrolase family 5 domain-containing protein n=1 Tax=Ilyomonas limi TaxID=2575867 RepID=A0A4V5UUI8_9BACT|nr:cellulase family glycosylhydrolase [Ilyomonas limi]TKK69263.1 hypothetical protein FC093_08060 [Ilyomonas limi]
MKAFAITTLLTLITTFLFAQQQTILQLHPQNPHYFLYQNKPTVIIGSGEHYGSVINPDFDYTKYLQTLAKDSLNITRLFTGAYIEKQGDFGIEKNTLAPAAERLLLPWKRSTVAGYALGGNKFDLNQWDENYFARLKNFIQTAAKNGVIVEVNLFSSHYGGGWNYSALNPKNNINQTDVIASNMVNTLENGNILKYQEAYVKKIVRELNGFDNMYFEIQNEPWADQTDTVLVRDEYGDKSDWRSTIQVVSKRSNDWQQKVTDWIKEAENSLPKKHLISQNISNFYYPIVNPDPDISIFNFHYAKPDAVRLNYHLNKVIGFNETGFAGKSYSTYRRQAWRFMMAGGGLFNHLDYSFSVNSETGEDTSFNAPGSGGKDLRMQLGILKRFFEHINFLQLKPDCSVVTSAPAAFTEALSNGHSQWVIYYEPTTTIPQPLTLQLPAGSYEAAWMDVVTGKWTSKTTIKNGLVNAPAGTNEKVLLVNVLATNK